MLRHKSQVVKDKVVKSKTSSEEVFGFTTLFFYEFQWSDHRPVGLGRSMKPFGPMRA